MRINFLTVLALGMAATGVNVAHATPLTLTITVTDGLGTLTNTYTDASSPNLISISGISMEGVTISYDIGIQTNGVLNVLTSNQTSVTNKSGSTATVTATLNGQNFFGMDGAFTVSGSGTWLGTPGSVLTQTWYNDPADGAVLSPGTEIASYSNTATGPTSSFSYSPGTGNLGEPDSGLFSQTEVSTYNLSDGGVLITTGMTEIASVPEPTTLALLGAGLFGIGMIKRRSLFVT